MGMIGRLPWWAKLGGKVVLSRLPLPYSAWLRMGLFRHGDMQRPEHALATFTSHFERARSYRELAPGFCCLEVGPGDSLLSAVMARAHGASRTYLVDSGSFATRELAPYQRLAALLKERGLPVPDLSQCGSLEEVMRVSGAIYLTDGLKSMATIPAGSVDFFWSQVVLEHIPRQEFQPFLRELARVVSTHGIGSHSVDLKDHLGGGLNNLRFSEQLWESGWMRRSGFYTNRIRYREMLHLFRQAGFATQVTKTYEWGAAPLSRRRLATPFRTLEDDDLRVSEFEVMLWPARSPT